MEKEFVTYEIALRMRELGYNDPCIAFHSKIYGLLHTSPTQNVNVIAGEVLAPTWQSAFEWFESKHRLFGNVSVSTIGGFINGIIPDDWEPSFNWVIYKPIGSNHRSDPTRWYSRIEAMELCLKTLCRTVEDKVKEEWELYLKQKEDANNNNI